MRCPVCDGDGIISLDAQFLPDVDIPCPECGGTRYSRQAFAIKQHNRKGMNFSLPELMAKDVETAGEMCAQWRNVASRLETLKMLGLSYLNLGEATPPFWG